MCSSGAAPRRPTASAAAGTAGAVPAPGQTQVWSRRELTPSCPTPERPRPSLGCGAAPTLAAREECPGERRTAALTCRAGGSLDRRQVTVRGEMATPAALRSGACGSGCHHSNLMRAAGGSRSAAGRDSGVPCRRRCPIASRRRWTCRRQWPACHGPPRRGPVADSTVWASRGSTPRGGSGAARQVARHREGGQAAPFLEALGVRPLGVCGL